jgi:hypothetical protein
MPHETHHLRDAAAAFDWDAVEDPLDLVREELRRLNLTRLQAEYIWHWHLQRGQADQAGEQTVADRLLLWLGSADDQQKDKRERRRPDRAATAGSMSSLERRLGLRAAVAIKEMQAYSRLNRLSYRALEQVFGVSKAEIGRLVMDFRKAFSLK